MKRNLVWMGLLVAVALLTPRANAALAADAKWTAKYYNNTTLTGTPVLQQQEDSINYDWGSGKPQSGVNSDNFSVKWTRVVNFSAGTYRFTATSDDGMRVLIDDSTVISMWVDQAATTKTADVTLSAGDHKIVVEYYDRTGSAVAKLSWDTTPTGSYPEWKGEYFDNKNLNGSPAVTRNDKKIDFDWGSGSPASGIDPDTFSVRWVRKVNFSGETYRFTASMDDGMRVWVDDKLIIDRWYDQYTNGVTADIKLSSGDHTIKVEYYENTGGAMAKLSWDVAPAASYPDWKGEYFNNTALSGSPALTRNDTDINFDWAYGSPASGINAESFAVRWTRTKNFNAGTYRFTATTDDGMRVWVDNNLVIDRWFAQAATTYTSDVILSAGNHTIKVEYFENTGQAVARLWWDPVGSTTYPDWKGEYFNNTTLSGSPALTRNDAAINFDWGYNSPASGVNTESFSVRWTRTQNFNAGTYRFTATTDDGMRVWVDNNLIIDRWVNQAATTYTSDVALTAGNHTVKVEYYENTGLAVAKLSWAPVGSGTYPDWKAEYFNNMTLSGSPVLTRNDSAILFDWGYGSPGTGVNTESFSARWTRTHNFNAGTYRFTATTDDGMRLWVDNNLIIDRWVNQAATTYSNDVALTAGNHTIKVEYYENTGLAVAKLSWALVDGTTYPDWKGEYFNNMTLSGSPTVTRNDTAIDFNWVYGSPTPGMAADHFSARWTRTANFAAGMYRFTVASDDGVRVWVDSMPIIDQWKMQAVTTYTADVNLTAGSHTIKVEYYENEGLATIRLNWGSGGTNPPGTVIMDNGGANYQFGGMTSDWYTMATGYNGSAQWSYNSPDARSSYNWARWYPNLTPGKYEVYVFIPSQNGTTHSAQYWVHTSSGYTLRVVDQSKIYGEWYSLGTYVFSGASYEFVSLSDVTYESYGTTRVAFDAVKFEPRP